MNLHLHEYQQRIVSFLKMHQNAILSVDMGLGKTISVLTFLQDLQPTTCLIVAPKRVALTVWAQEAQKWGLPIADKFRIVKGTKAQRLKALQDSDTPYKIVSRDNLADLANTEWEVLVLDELTSFKTIDSARSKAVRSISAQRKIGLTGTFLANGAIDIYGQCAAVGLERWRLNFYAWRATFFRDVLQGSGLSFQKWAPTKTLPEILAAVQDDIFTLTAADYLEIPDKMESVVSIELSKETYESIAEMDAFLSTEINGEIFAIKERQKFAKLQTLCNGFVYDENGNSIRAKQSDKLNHVAELVCELVEQGEQVLLFYAYRDEAVWLHELLAKRKIKVASVSRPDFLELWNGHEIDVLFAHPASAGHGLNLQHGGRCIVWSTMTYNYELFAQGNARLARQGQTKNVQIFYCVAKNTVEEKIAVALTKKDKAQNDFLELTKK